MSHGVSSQGISSLQQFHVLFIPLCKCFPSFDGSFCALLRPAPPTYSHHITMSAPPTLLMALPTELHALIISLLSPYDIHVLGLVNRHLASITPASSIISLPTSFDLPSYLEFWDIHALRLINRHFARITPPLPSLKEMNDILADMSFSHSDDYDGSPIIEFNESWLAITSNEYFSLYHGKIESPYIWMDSVDGTGGASVSKPAS